ncbi:hypothetical protein [Alkalihalobacillus sp. AL-G]|uniref:hypothetical protein n=1 Tax=Alkalihalobacillus sp. AL-G TaxID=2926399 RepID=UPI00272C14CC|nr:hypothetical protein [Alkalihalobacillus sp. AL-G]WLD95281.1 hypothetical protein MOJ78_10525 [Alkalihalobacillus sp. AL-G]
MAFGITRDELIKWKENVKKNEVSFLTHFWIDERFPTCNTVTKAGCCDLEKLKKWGKQYGLHDQWIDDRSGYPHFDLFGDRQLSILKKEDQWDQIKRFKLD